MRDYASLYSALLEDLDLADESDNHIYSDMDFAQAARVQLRASFFKKLCPSGVSKHADDAALKKFIAVNASLPTGPFDFAPSNEAESCFWDYFCNHLNTCIQPNESQDTFDLDFIREHMDVGPGAAQKADSTHG